MFLLFFFFLVRVSEETWWEPWALERADLLLRNISFPFILK